MKKIFKTVFALLAALCLTVAFLPVPAFAGSAEDANQYGDALTDATKVRIKELLDQPDTYLGELVKVEGLVEDVCPMKGCWIDILDSQTSTTVRFKVEDDVIVFPAEAKGKDVVAEGVLEKREMDKQQAINWLRHLADEKGETFDESTVTGPMTFYQLAGKGAELGTD